MADIKIVVYGASKMMAQEIEYGLIRALSSDIISIPGPVYLVFSDSEPPAKKWTWTKIAMKWTVEKESAEQEA